MANLITPPEGKSFRSGVQWAWDATSLKAASECPMKYSLSILNRYSKNEGKSADLIFGAHYATAIEHYYKLRITSGLSHEDALLSVLREAFINTWEQPKEGEPGIGHPWTSAHPTKNRWSLFRSILWYFFYYEEDGANDSRVAIIGGKPALELSFELSVEADISFCGHMDRVVVTDSNSLMVMDQKTTKSELNERYFAGYDLDIQMSMYPFVGRALYAVETTGVIIDAAQVLVGGTTFYRSPTYRTKGHLDEWYKETIDIIRKTQDYTSSGFFPRNTTACGYYGGCPFKELCACTPSIREKFLRANYHRIDAWDPIKRR